uniref:Uncharacterized protein n=1 Tax=Setaria viridis TaxID=4556 RepID=A0A4U6U6R8_SETVI|nr:hypothetical protein SEVIR_6G093600v2 [Setaria viridis]TKW09424.1 hypothetical protein SEVIR_6G093600v2 [Setaria viridis]
MAAWQDVLLGAGWFVKISKSCLRKKAEALPLYGCVFLNLAVLFWYVYLDGDIIQPMHLFQSTSCSIWTYELL